MKDTVTVIVGGREYKVKKSKEQWLKKWLESNSDLVEQTSEDLIVDIEHTTGVEIEYNELKVEAKEKDEGQSEESEK